MTYIENFNPGFQEYTADDFTSPQESLEAQKNRRSLLKEIGEEFDRLQLYGDWAECFARDSGLGDPNSESILNLRLFLDRLKRIEVSTDSNSLEL